MKLRRDITKEDRNFLKIEQNNANKHNDEGSEEEKEVFFYRMVRPQVKKWLIMQQ